MNVLLKIVLFTFASTTVVQGQERKNLVVLRKGQKIFLERADYMNDKIYAVTERVDTVEVIVADKAFYKFRNGDFEAWAITNQLNQDTEILGKQSEVVYPFSIQLSKVIPVYKEGKLGADKLQDLKRGQKIRVNSKSGYFYEVEFDNKIGYAHISTIAEPAKTHYHIMRAVFDEFNSLPAPQTQESYIRNNGKFISRYQSGGYLSETYKVGSTLYTITTYNGRTEISSYTTDW